jgi:asparagine synthase (glutamine-hydrolysing)
LFDLAMSAVEPLVSRGIVRREFLDDLVGTHMKAEPGYYGVMLWLLMMLGLWLDSRHL